MHRSTLNLAMYVCISDLYNFSRCNFFLNQCADTGGVRLRAAKIFIDSLTSTSSDPPP